MTDRQTLDAYEREAAQYAEEWTAQDAPTDLYALLDAYFQPGPTADVGCGAGRDAAWLAAQGHDVIGIDASPALLAEARRRYPALRFVQAALPELEGVAEGQFANVLCETVIMHLDAGSIPPAVAKLVALLRPGGTLYLSWRVTPGADKRDGNGRLYAAFVPDVVLRALDGADVLFDEEVTSRSSGKTVHRIVARKADRPAA
jgi:SAM-dependent methyltransferase